MMKRLRRNILSMLALLCAGSVAQAATYYVATNGNDNSAGTQGSPFQSIQRALNVAVAGDTVLVANGTYSGPFNRNLRFDGKDLVLRSEGGPENCIIDCAQENTTVDMRGFFFVGGETEQAVLDGFTIKNGRVKTQGGGILIRNGSNPTIKNCIVMGNTVQGDGAANPGGGGISITSASATLIHCTLQQNSVFNTGERAKGGGVSVTDGSLTLRDCTISENATQATGAWGVGGGIALEHSGVSMTDCHLSGNRVQASGETSSSVGGGLAAIDSTSALTLTNCEFVANTLTNNDFTCAGAGGYLLNTSVTGVNCRFADNHNNGSASAFGGGLFQLGGVSVFTDSTFTGNSLIASTQVGGAGVSLQDNARMTLTRCALSNNDQRGGFESNGSGLNNAGSTATLTQCTLADNQILNFGFNTVNAGSGASVHFGTLTLDRCTFSGNEIIEAGGLNAGGGLGSGYSTTVVKGCVFRDNRLHDNSIGAGAYFEHDLPGSHVVNSLFEGNSVDNYAAGAALILRDTAIPITHCVFVGNSSLVSPQDDFSGGTLQTQRASSPVTNCIFFNNDTNAGVREIVAYDTPTPTVTYCNVEGGYPGTGNINADPRFVNAANGDYRLQSNSPCRNAGTAGAPALPPYDYAGYARNQGGAPDMGIYEVGTVFAFDRYVDKATGSDATGNGTPAAPYKTVTRALTDLSDPFGLAAIYIKAGSYGTDRPRITRQVKLINWTNTGQASIGKP